MDLEMGEVQSNSKDEDKESNREERKDEGCKKDEGSSKKSAGTASLGMGPIPLLVMNAILTNVA